MTTCIIVQQHLLYKWEDTEFQYPTQEDGIQTAIDKAKLPAREITRMTGRRTRIVKRLEEVMEEVTPAQLRT